MNETVFLWTITATIFAGVQLFVQKVVAHERRSAALNGLFMYGISGLVAIAVLIFQRSLPQSWPFIAAFGALAGASHSIGNYIRIESLKHIDTVMYFPLNKLLGPLIVVIGGIFIFSEPLSLRAYIGIGLSLTVPLLLISSAERHRQRNLRLGILLMVISTILTAGSTLLTKQGLSYAPEILFLLSVSQIAGTAISAAILVKQNGSRFLHAEADRRDILLGVAAGTLGLGAYFALLEALSQGYVSLVYVIQAHYILIPIILSVWWYKDHINVRKLAAIAISSLAITMLYSV